jgi:hypothetical protein
MIELVRLAEAEEQLRARVDQVNVDARRAQAELLGAREALVAIERAAGPDGPTPQQRSAAEKRLARAEQNAGAPWRERIAGAERAAQDGRQRMQLHATEHLAELVGELEENGAETAAQVDHAAEMFMAATLRRTEAEQALTAVVALTRRMTPHDINRPRGSEAVRAVQALLAAGGEVGPALLAREPLPT